MKKFTELSKAAEYALTITGRWQLAESDERYGRASLPGLAEASDAENPLDEDDFYLVSPGGAIGMCMDGDEIDWLFLPTEGSEEELPYSFLEISKTNGCPQCKNPVNESDHFCGSCGQKLS